MRSAFTLVELLVVVTIIVVLLALLTPAMDRALYEAELTVCGAQQHSIGSAVLVYAGSHRRRYPHRQMIANNDVVEPSFLKGNYDDRLMLDGYMGLKNYNDPMAGELDFSPVMTGGSEVFASYDLWWGFKYKLNGGFRGMEKIGDRFAFAFDHANRTPTGPGVRRYTFDLLAGDSDVINSAHGSMEVSHPDAWGTLTQMVLQNQTQTNVPPFLPVAVKTTARWVNWASDYRGPIDQNFLSADGSVNRYRQVLGGDPDQPDDWGYLTDERMVPVPRWNSSYDLAGAWMWNHIPPAR